MSAEKIICADSLSIQDFYKSSIRKQEISLQSHHALLTAWSSSSLLQSSARQDGRSEQLIGEEVAAGTELTWHKIKQSSQASIHTYLTHTAYIWTSYAYFRFAFRHTYSINNRESLHHKCAICVFIVCDILMSGCQYCCCQLCSVHWE